MLKLKFDMTMVNLRNPDVIIYMTSFAMIHENFRPLQSKKKQ